MHLYINGRFLTRRATGVERVAGSLVYALDALLPAGSCTLLCPRGAQIPQLKQVAVQQVGWPGQPMHLWEQLTLPWVARRGWLLNLAGGAPALALRQACMLHDAAVFDHAEAYSAPFVTWYRCLFRWLAFRGVPLMTVSRFSRQRLAQHLGLAPDTISVVSNGADHLDDQAADLHVLERYGLQTGPWLLAVASQNPTKNLATLVRAFSQLNDPEVRLVLVGGLNHQVFSAAEAVQALADPRVLHLGPVDDATLVALYRHALGLVFPSVYEGFGLPPLEAMRQACPVLASSAAAIPEVCADAALYFDPMNADALAKAMQRLLHEPPLRAALRNAGLAHAEGYTWAAAAKTLHAQLRRWGAIA